MPNHIHWIIIIDKNDNVETRHCLVSTNNELKQNRFQNQWKWTISSIIWSFKSICTKTINKSQNKIFFSWQPNYYDRIIKNEEELQKIRKYIKENPLKWDLDKNNTENIFM
jgi:REP element-mobilizing transposase RayT